MTCHTARPAFLTWLAPLFFFFIYMGFYDEKKALFHYFKFWNEVGSTYRHTPIPMNKQTLLQRCENAFKSRGDNFFLLVNKSFHFPLFRSPLLQIKSGSKVLAAALKQSARSRTALVESKKGLSTLVLLLKDKDEMIVGNAALGLSLCSEVRFSIVEFFLEIFLACPSAFNLPLISLPLFFSRRSFSVWLTTKKTTLCCWYRRHCCCCWMLMSSSSSLSLLFSSFSDCSCSNFKPLTFYKPFECVSQVPKVAEKLTKTQIIKHLLMLARDSLKPEVMENCAILLAKLAQKDSRHLERLRVLHGIEILHSCMKYIKT